MKKSTSPLNAAIQAARKLHQDNSDFNRTAGAVRRAAYNLLDAIEGLPATADCQAVVSELDPDDLRLLQEAAGMDGAAVAEERNRQPWGHASESRTLLKDPAWPRSWIDEFMQARAELTLYAPTGLWWVHPDGSRLAYGMERGAC